MFDAMRSILSPTVAWPEGGGPYNPQIGGTLTGVVVRDVLTYKKEAKHPQFVSYPLGQGAPIRGELLN